MSQNTPWWRKKQSEILEITKSNKTPLYIYDLQTVKEKTECLFNNLTSIDRIYYALKANDHPDVLKTLNSLKQKVCFECVSIQEVHYLLDLFPSKNRNEILFTPNFCGKEEYEEALKLNIHVTVDCVFPLERWPEIFKDKSISIRIDSGKQHGHHEFVKTASFRSKFGISPIDLPTINLLTKKHNISIVGLHSHVGSGILENQVWSHNAKFLFEMADEFFKNSISFINIGGGLGIVENPNRDLNLNLDQVNQNISEIKKLRKNNKIEIHMEPGRFFVGEAGILVTSVTQIKQKEKDKWYVGCDCGFNSLLRPALYSSWHQIVNLSRKEEDKTINADIVGQICESGDILGKEREMPASTDYGDILLIGTAGAYGATMSLSCYNQREPAKQYSISL